MSGKKEREESGKWRESTNQRLLGSSLHQVNLSALSVFFFKLRLFKLQLFASYFYQAIGKESLWWILKKHLTLSLRLGLNDKWGKETSSIIFLFRIEQKRKGKKEFIGTVLSPSVYCRNNKTIPSRKVNNDHCSYNRRIG